MCCGKEREREEERRGQVVGEREEEQIRVSLGGKEMVVMDSSVLSVSL